MCNDECVPAVYVKGKKKGQHVTGCRGRQIARKELIKRDGPCPPDKDLCRHTCDNDSMAPNGFVCILHTVWGTHKENAMDASPKMSKGAKKRFKREGGISQSKAGKAGSKIANSIERTCPYCGRTIRGPGYFNHERACHRRLQVSLLENDAGR